MSWFWLGVARSEGLLASAAFNLSPSHNEIDHDDGLLPFHQLTIEKPWAPMHYGRCKMGTNHFSIDFDHRVPKICTYLPQLPKHTNKIQIWKTNIWKIKIKSKKSIRGVCSSQDWALVHNRYMPPLPPSWAFLPNRICSLETQHMLYFWKALGTRTSKQCSQVSDMQIHRYKKGLWFTIGISNYRIILDYIGLSDYIGFYRIINQPNF